MLPSSHLLIVTPDSAQPQRGVLQYESRTLPCVLGRAGILAHKVEGDGGTPVGQFPLRRLLYRADKLALPKTALKTAAIARDDGWCDDPADVHYNQPVKLPYPASAETLWRDDDLYDLVVVIGHNDDPVMTKAGSAIFMHVAPPAGAPTAGCVALARDDLLWLLGALRPDAIIDIRKNP